MDDYDVIVIGGGLGGLTAAAKLAKEGQRLLLIEQHYVVGGCATNFKRKDFSMEVGLHALDGLDADDPKLAALQDLGILDNIEFIRLPEFYRFTNDRVDIVIPFNTEEATAVLVKTFPEERKGIEKFFRTVHAIRREIGRFPQTTWHRVLLSPLLPFLFPNLIFNTYQTLGRFLDKIITNEDLKLVLGANIQYYHDDPYSMSLVFYSAAQASYYRGGHFIKGGAQKLSNHLAQVIQSHHGEVLLGHLVTRILMHDGAAVGVEYRQTRGSKRETKTAFGKKIIVNASIMNVADMLPENCREPITKKTANLESACSILSIYIGFKRRIKELGNGNYSTIVFDPAVKNQGGVLGNHQGPVDHRNFTFVDYSQIDSGLTNGGKGFGMVCTVDYIGEWDKLDEKEYQARKEQVARMFFARLEKVVPNISREIDCYEVGTSRTIRRFTLNPRGTVYGFAQTPKQSGMFRLPNQSPLKNLYFASAWAAPGGGFTGAILSGWYCANKILREK